MNSRCISEIFRAFRDFLSPNFWEGQGTNIPEIIRNLEIQDAFQNL